MAKTRRAYTGGAASTTTSSNILSSGTTSFTITAYTGWPYGSDPFFVVVEPGTANEEKILVTRTGSTDTTINVYATPSVAANRGADGTSSVAHSSGVTVFPVFTALDADEANELTSAFGSKGDLVSYGSSTFETLGVGSDDTVLIADSGEASGLKWGSVDTAQLADDAVTTAKIDDGAVDTAQLAAGAVTSPKISLAYADSSARAAALPSPSEGDLSYLSDTNTVEVYDGSAWVSVGGATMIKKVARFTSSGSWTVPAGVTYAIAHMLGGGGGGGGLAGLGGTGGTSSVAFAGGTVSALGGKGGNGNNSSSTSGASVGAASANSGGGGPSSHFESGASNGRDAQWIVAGAAVTPAASITVTVGAGGVRGDASRSANGGSGYVWIEYQEPA